MRVKLIHVASRKEKVLELPERNGVVFGRNNLEDALINCGDTVPEPGNHHIEGNLQYVSRGQCTFYLKGNENPVIVDGYLINEEGKEISYRSKNGTYLNGVLVPGQGEIIRNGDVLRFGSEEMGDSFGFEIIVERGDTSEETNLRYDSSVPETVELDLKCLRSKEGENND